MPQRRHRWITAPSGALLVGCLALPGYQDCGHSHAMTHLPILVVVCAFGGVAALAGLLMRGRLERAVAIVCTVLSLVCLGFLTLACLAFDHVYAGVTLGVASSASLVVGGLIWEREARGKPEAAAYLMRILAPAVVIGLVLTAMLSEWEPLPDKDISVPYLGPH